MTSRTTQTPPRQRRSRLPDKMRSHPYTAPPPLPPILDELATMLPVPKPAHHHHSRDDSDIPLDMLDHDTSRLIPAKRRSHRVWVQGQLAVVRSVTSTLSKVKSTSRRDRGVSGTRRRSLGDADHVGDEDEEHDEQETALRAKQMRGYGIGGFGNIRESYYHHSPHRHGARHGGAVKLTWCDLGRPTDVIHGPDPPSSPFSPGIRSSSTGGSSTDDLPDKQKRGLREIFMGTPDSKGKSRAP